MAAREKQKSCVPNVDKDRLHSCLLAHLAVWLLAAQFPTRFLSPAHEGHYCVRVADYSETQDKWRNRYCLLLGKSSCDSTQAAYLHCSAWTADVTGFINMYLCVISLTYSPFRRHGTPCFKKWWHSLNNSTKSGPILMIFLAWMIVNLSITCKKYNCITLWNAGLFHLIDVRHSSPRKTRCQYCNLRKFFKKLFNVSDIIKTLTAYV